MDRIREITSEIIAQHRDKLPASVNEITRQIDEKLDAIGSHAAREDWNEQMKDPTCANDVKTRTCHKVNHGDGTYSETWCDAWHCF